MTQPIKVGIIGAGAVTIFHYRGYTAAGAHIKAMADIDARALEARRREWGIPEGYHDYHDMLADPEIEAVSICLPNALHHSAAIAAARAGKHVLCEKPLSLSLERGREMIQACREAGVILQTGHHLRSGAEAAKARALIQSGALGRLTYIRLRQAHDWAGASTIRDSFAKLAHSGGGTLLDNGCHLMDLARFYGGSVQRLHASTATLGFDIEVEDTASVSVQFESGALATIEASWVATGWENAFSIYGTKGALEYTNRLQPAVMRHYFRESPGTTWDKPDVAVYQLGGLDAHSRAVVDFLEAVRGQREVVCTGEDGLEAVRLVLASYESARSGRPVALSEFPASGAAADLTARPPATPV